MVAGRVKAGDRPDLLRKFGDPTEAVFAFLLSTRAGCANGRTRPVYATRCKALQTFWNHRTNGAEVANDDAPYLITHILPAQ